MIAYFRRLARRLHQDTSGAMSIEKVLIITLISLPLIIMLWIFRDKLKQWFSDQTAQLKP